MSYKLTVGLEVHVELNTKTKMFCACRNDTSAAPNTNICPICLGHPGTLPTPNIQAVISILRLGLVLNGRLADWVKFDRKNYFYPDIPKGYQISQYDEPLVAGGELAGVAVTRAHLEEDTARNQHHPKKNISLVDFNRGGLPLLELVTEPVIETAEQAGFFARELRLVLGPEYLNISDANMELGQMRVEANVSVSQTDKLGTKVEVKNLNSFKAVEKAIAYEYDRQISVLEAGGQIEQETRGWDENKGVTFSQRKKEMSHDYRYFPDPDLPRIKLKGRSGLVDLEKTIPESPAQKRQRFQAEFDIKESDIEILISSKNLADLFETTLVGLGDSNQAQLIANYITSDVVGILKTIKEAKLPETEALVELLSLVISGELSSRGAKEVLAVIMSYGGSPKAVATEKNLFQQSGEEELVIIVKKVIIDNPEVVSDFKAGNEKVLQFLVGQGMKASGGAANPKILAEIIRKEIK
ncbi:MAG: Asp-tRNA(Asn)/Glu-tRNA(Gln) amidotransferase subunit GatB [Patescibacteria group bacterium]